MDIFLPVTEELKRVAQRVVWLKSPEDALENPLHFIALALTYGTHADTKILLKYLTETQLKEAIEHAPTGIFDPRSWAYWNLKIGRYPTPPLPRRILP